MAATTAYLADADDGPYVGRPRIPETDPLYQVMAGHLETFLERTRCSERRLPAYVESYFAAP